MSKLFGRVSRGEEAALDAVVELHNSAGDVVDQVQVDEAGDYKYHLVEGTWSLSAWDPRGHRADHAVELSQDADQRVDIELVDRRGGGAGASSALRLV